MKKVIIFTALFLYGFSAAAAPIARCVKEVNEQESGLAAESSATPENKYKILDKLEKSEFNALSDSDATVLKRLLMSRSAMVFSFSNDAGNWITVADFTTCKVLGTYQVDEI